MSGRTDNNNSKAAGFSLIELTIAMGVTLVILTVASTLLAQTLAVRLREDRRTDALADAQRSLNIMSREIANAALSLPSPLTYTPPGTTTPSAVPSNGVLPGYSDGDNFGFVSNLNAFTGDGDVSDTDEALYYSFYTDASDKSFLIRKDMNSGGVLVLANRIDSVAFVYVNRNPLTGALTDGAANSQPTANTVGIKITIAVTLPEVGTAGSPGYQPASQTQLTSEVVMRNAVLDNF
ncbi:MAG TPA: prepilin-type N-terminal cleavage/methylation domain-containing protein [Pyrinomonadaceae bacterium]|jgi:type II secretory pathway pseudopilin PulG|nr:prepilin-type N-terminal cleavage/methylation domain-containing protein [Pyrinomonadaceae bacterium]